MSCPALSRPCQMAGELGRAGVLGARTTSSEGKGRSTQLWRARGDWPLQRFRWRKFRGPPVSGSVHVREVTNGSTFLPRRRAREGAFGWCVSRTRRLLVVLVRGPAFMSLKWSWWCFPLWRPLFPSWLLISHVSPPALWSPLPSLSPPRRGVCPWRDPWQSRPGERIQRDGAAARKRNPDTGR